MARAGKECNYMAETFLWTDGAARIPGDTFLRRFDRRWRDGVEFAAADACQWLRDPLHSFVLTHLDRAAFRRRISTVFLTQGDTHDSGHGFGPSADLFTGDTFGPQEIEARHTGDRSPLEVALELVRDDPYLLAIPILTERMYASADTFTAHAVQDLHPTRHGAVLPVMYVPADEELDELDAREDVLRAGGLTTYTVDVNFTERDITDIHRSVATALEDALDSISHLKAPGADDFLPAGLSWPLVALRADRSWDPDRCRSARDGAALPRPRAGVEGPRSTS